MALTFLLHRLSGKYWMKFCEVRHAANDLENVVRRRQTGPGAQSGAAFLEAGPAGGVGGEGG